MSSPLSDPNPVSPDREPETWSFFPGWKLLILLAILLRLVQYAELRETPCPWFHNWEKSDMNYFHELGIRLANGDWLNHNSYHPLIRDQREPIEAMLRTCPETRPTPQQLADAGIATDSAAWIMNRFCGDQAFHQEPLFSYLVGVTYKFFGPDPRWIFLWNSLFGVGSLLLLLTLATRWFGPSSALISGVLYLLCGPILHYELSLLREPLLFFVTLLILLVFDVARHQQENSLLPWFFCGVVFGGSLLAKSIYSPLFLAYLTIWSLQNRRLGKPVFRPLLVCFVGGLLLLSPLVFRNAQVGAPWFKLAGARASTVIAIFNIPDMSDHPYGLYRSPLFPKVLDNKQNSVFSILRETIAIHGSVQAFLGFLGKKFLMIWSWYEIPDNLNLYFSQGYSKILQFAPITFLTLAPLGLIGIVLAWRKWTAIWPALLLAGFHILLMTATFPSARYRLLLFPVFIITGGWTIHCLTDWYKQRRWGRLTGVLAVFFLLAFGMLELPLPEPNQPRIHSAYAMAGFKTFYGPHLMAAEQTGNLDELTKGFSGFLQVLPDLIQQRLQTPRPMTAEERPVVDFYRKNFEAASKVFEVAGNQEQAQHYASQAERLKKLP